MKTNKPHMNIRAMSDKITMFVVPDIRITTMAINNHMVVIQV
jgi:hypothetical protein